MRFLDLSKPVWQAIGKMGSIMLLSFLWLFVSLPIVTIGAATAALNSKTADVMNGFDKELIKGFFQVFCSCFVKTTMLWLGALIIFVIGLLDLKFLSLQEGGLASASNLLLFIGLFFVLSVLEGSFIKTEYRKENAVEYVKRIAFFSLRKFPKIMLLFAIQMIVITFVLTDALILFPFFPGICSYFTCFIFKNDFRRGEVS